MKKGGTDNGLWLVDMHSQKTPRHCPAIQADSSIVHDDPLIALVNVQGLGLFSHGGKDVIRKYMEEPQRSMLRNKNPDQNESNMDAMSFHDTGIDMGSCENFDVWYSIRIATICAATHRAAFDAAIFRLRTQTWSRVSHTVLYPLQRSLSFFPKNRCFFFSFSGSFVSFAELFACTEGCGARPGVPPIFIAPICCVGGATCCLCGAGWTGGGLGCSSGSNKCAGA